MNNPKKGVIFRNTLQALPYLAPALILYSVFFLRPLVQLVWLSFHKWNGIGPKNFVGLGNYVGLLTDDPFFWNSLQHNLYWVLAATAIPLTIGLMLAIFLSRSKHLRGKAIFRTLYFIPQVLSSVLVAITWRWIYSPNDGALNQVLELLGLSFLKYGWLGDPNTALPALFIVWSWVHYGFCMVIFIAALQGIDEEYFDAAKVDGANWWQQFRYILVPFIRGPMTTVILITVIAAVQVFDYVYIITRGGPMSSTQVIASYMYQNAFGNARVGYGSAIATVMGIIILAFSIIFLRYRGALLSKEAS
jgi:ABC-type sugar transport system permease subunit